MKKKTKKAAKPRPKPPKPMTMWLWAFPDCNDETQLIMCWWMRPTKKDLFDEDSKPSHDAVAVRVTVTTCHEVRR